MKFGHHLYSHLTPEWRHYYVDYDGLKKMIYDIVSGRDWTKEDDDLQEEDELLAISFTKQTEFFDEIERQRQNVEGFYEVQESELKSKLSHYLSEFNRLASLQMNNSIADGVMTPRAIENQRKHLVKALCEFYLNIELLKRFKELNYTGFRKLLKKHDKLTESNKGMDYYNETVCSSRSYCSKELQKMIKQTEETTILLEHGNRGRAMSKLRVPPLDEGSLWVSFRTGWLMGAIFICVIATIITFVFRVLDKPWATNHASYFGLRAYFLLTLWFYAFAVNIYGWRRAGVNNVLIFEFNPRTPLTFQQIFEVASLMGLLFIISLLLFLFSDWFGIPDFVGPLFCWTVTIVAFFLPLPIFYFRSRIWLMKELGRILLAPFFSVTFPDFWIADQLNSLAIVLLDMEYFICFLVYGIYASPDSIVQCHSVFYGIRPLVAVLPAWWRFAQCLRRYYDTRKVNPHLINAGKYSTAFFVVFFSSTASGISASASIPWYYTIFGLWILATAISSCYTYAWDIRKDWGLFEKGKLLRSELIYSKKIYYYLAVIENLILRWTWTLTISLGEGGSKVIDGDILGTIFGTFEIFRRFVWNFFRVENEHLNNCGEFRVVRKEGAIPTENITWGFSNPNYKPIRPTLRRRVSIDQTAVQFNGIKSQAKDESHDVALSVLPETNILELPETDL